MLAHRLPTGELVFPQSLDESELGFGAWVSSLLGGESMSFALTLVSVLSTIWILAG